MKNYSKRISIRGLIKSFSHAFRGFLVLLEHEYNLYIQIGFGLLAIACGFYFKISPHEWAMQTTVTGLVIFAELMNTAFEKSMDLLHPDIDRRVKDIKDLASASVLFMVIIAVAVGLFIYIPKLGIVLT